MTLCLSASSSTSPSLAVLPLAHPFPQVLQHLTKKRPVSVDRTQFFAHAEAFAVLVKIDFVSVDGVCSVRGWWWCREGGREGREMRKGVCEIIAAAPQRNRCCTDNRETAEQARHSERSCDHAGQDSRAML